MIRDLSNIAHEQGGDALRVALIESQFPARLIAFFHLDKSPSHMKKHFQDHQFLTKSQKLLSRVKRRRSHTCCL